MAKPSVSKERSSLSVNTEDFNRFARQLRLAVPELKSQIRIQLLAAGKVVATEAETIVRGASETVPASIAARTSGATVYVQAGGPGVPMGGLLELGNQKSSGGSTFRHPVFGNRDVWVDQPMYPYLLPAVSNKADEVEALVTDALQSAIDVAVA